jgi:hypothetical protein
MRRMIVELHEPTDWLRIAAGVALLFLVCKGIAIALLWAFKVALMLATLGIVFFVVPHLFRRAEATRGLLVGQLR